MLKFLIKDKFTEVYIYIYSCLKKRRLYTTKASCISCYFQSSGILFVLCSKNDKNVCQSQYMKNKSSNKIKNIRIQFCKSLSKLCYY